MRTSIYWFSAYSEPHSHLVIPRPDFSNYVETCRKKRKLYCTLADSTVVERTSLSDKSRVRRIRALLAHVKIPWTFAGGNELNEHVPPSGEFEIENKIHGRMEGNRERKICVIMVSTQSDSCRSYDFCAWVWDSHCGRETITSGDMCCVNDVFSKSTSSVCTLVEVKFTVSDH